jgi:hypothetical protein
MNKVTILIVLVAVAASLRVGTLSCCPETYVYDEDTLRCVCPVSAPYISNTGRCIACNAPATWDNSTKTCQKCRADQSEDANGNCVCPKATPYDNGKICDVCPDDLPIWNGYKCVACPPATNYDVNSKTCTVCPEGLVYVKAARTCQVVA